MPFIGILELLGLRGFDLKSRFKFVRHQDTRWDMQSLLREGWFETYQAFQSKPKFDDCDFIITFTGLESSRALLHGLYRVGKRSASASIPFPRKCPYKEWHKAGYHYELTKVSGFDDFCGRVVIEWGKDAINWVKPGDKDKTIYEILPAGRTLPPFKDYLDISLTFAELCTLHSHPEANPEWRSRLKAVAGIYLIVATTTGKQYVGAASGAEGIWGRWACYTKDGHAENVHLLKLIKSNNAYPGAFTFSLLQIVPRSYARNEVLRLEKQYKGKLGRRATCLNGN